MHRTTVHYCQSTTQSITLVSFNHCMGDYKMSKILVCLALFKARFNFFFNNLNEGKKNKHSPKFPNNCNCTFF
ncbi:hypothetical protein VNO80_08145 [Phaseolus coccineus]|uniref:Uncharacterized protein n=1 Tax=Phaseolus coccineus TaxID=3886 RepID=A0AAN9NRT9_PHACN